MQRVTLFNIRMSQQELSSPLRHIERTRVEWNDFVIYSFYLRFFLNIFRLHLSLTDAKISYTSCTPMKSQQVFLQCCCTVFLAYYITTVFSSCPQLRTTWRSMIIAVSLPFSFSTTNSLSLSRIFYRVVSHILISPA